MRSKSLGTLRASLSVFFLVSCPPIWASQLQLSPVALGGPANCSELLGHLRLGAIPSKFTYLGKGAELWASLMQNSNSISNEPEVKLLYQKIPLLSREPRFANGANFVDIGPGDGKKAAEILKLWNQKAVHYMGVDVSADVLSMAIKQVEKIPGVTIARQITDVESNDFRAAVQSVEKATQKPTAFFLLGQTLGNPRNIPRFLSNVSKSMSNDSVLVVGLDLYQVGKIEALVREYSNPAYLDMDLWVLREVGLIPGQNGKVKIDFDYQTRNIRGVFVLSKEVTVATRNEASGLVEEVRLLPGQEIVFFQSHRFTRDELYRIFASTHLSIVAIAEDPKTGFALITANVQPGTR